MPLEPGESLQMANDIEVTAFRVTAAVAIEGATVQRQEGAQPATVTASTLNAHANPLPFPRRLTVHEVAKGIFV